MLKEIARVFKNIIPNLFNKISLSREKSEGNVEVDSEFFDFLGFSPSKVDLKKINISIDSDSDSDSDLDSDMEDEIGYGSDSDDEEEEFKGRRIGSDDIFDLSDTEESELRACYKDKFYDEEKLNIILSWHKNIKIDVPNIVDQKVYYTLEQKAYDTNRSKILLNKARKTQALAGTSGQIKMTEKKIKGREKNAENNPLEHQEELVTKGIMNKPLSFYIDQLEKESKENNYKFLEI